MFCRCCRGNKHGWHNHIYVYIKYATWMVYIIYNTRGNIRKTMTRDCQRVEYVGKKIMYLYRRIRERIERERERERDLRWRSQVASDRRACLRSVASVQAAKAPVRHSVNNTATKGFFSLEKSGLPNYYLIIWSVRIPKFAKPRTLRWLTNFEIDTRSNSDYERHFC